MRFFGVVPQMIGGRAEFSNVLIKLRRLMSVERHRIRKKCYGAFGIQGAEARKPMAFLQFIPALQ